MMMMMMMMMRMMMMMMMTTTTTIETPCQINIIMNSKQTHRFQTKAVWLLCGLTMPCAVLCFQ
jgi:uncharacterized membrane protein YfcA